MLVRFRGDPSEPLTTAAADRMFTAAGRGTLNVVDWFDDNTHGAIDMSGNRVFGWYELPDTLAEYSARRTDGTYPRVKIVELARAAAAAAGQDLSGFTAVVAITNVGVDLFGGTGVVCASGVRTGLQYWEINVAPSVICQEIIHGLGVLTHARRHGSDDDYRDPYDVMSMFNASAGHHPDDPGLPIGPGLNAAFMHNCGWLDTARIAPDGRVQLRPLHRRDLAGPLYAQAGGYFVEYRPSHRWDTGFASIVLVHYIANGTSYLMAELGAGQQFSWGDPGDPFTEHGTISVEEIDDATLTATVATRVTPPARVPQAGPAWSLFGSEWGDGGGLVILGGRVIKIPPRSPSLAVLEAVASVASLEQISIAPALRSQAQAELLAEASARLDRSRIALTEPHSPLDDLDMEAVRHLQARRDTHGTR
ncbi:MAG: hypothetical protein U0237_15695 [Thermoleophilia bacterium]